MILLFFKGYAYKQVYIFCSEFKEETLIYLEHLHLRCKYKCIQQKLKTQKYQRIEYEQCKIVISSEVLCIFIKFTLRP